MEDVRGAWGAVLAGVKSEKISAALFLMEGAASAVEGVNVTVNFPSKYVFYKEALERNENRCIIEKHLKSILSADLRLKFVIVDSSTASEARRGIDNLQVAAPVEAAPEALLEEPRPKPEPVQPARTPFGGQAEPIIDSAVKIFRAKVIRKD